jgi:hypothetical protein
MIRVYDRVCKGPKGLIGSVDEGGEAKGSDLDLDGVVEEKNETLAARWTGFYILANC